MKQSKLLIQLIVVFLLTGFLPSYATDQFVSMKVGETETFYFPSEVASRSNSITTCYCYSDHANNVEVLSYTGSSVTVKALAYTQARVTVQYHYSWDDNGTPRHDIHTVHIDLNDDYTPDNNPDNNPSNYNNNYGNWGTINIEVGQSKTVYSNIDAPNPDKMVSVVWSDYNELGYAITSQSWGSCTIRGRYAMNGQKLWCLWKYGKSTYKAYYTVNITNSNKETLSISANPSGGSISKGSKVYLSSSVSGVDFYYTLNGNYPTTSSNKYSSSGIVINESCTLKAFATKSGYNNSPVMTWVFNVVDNGKPYALWCAGNKTLYFLCSKSDLKDGGTYNNQKITKAWSDDKIIYAGYWNDTPWHASEIRESIEKVIFEPTFANAKPVTCSEWFSACYNISEFVGLGNLNTSEVQSMYGMFFRCYNLESIDLSQLNVPKLTNVSHMFWVCNKLKKIKFGDFDTSNITDMYGMFGGCEVLEELDLSSFNTSNVTNMSSMFSGCRNLRELDLSSFDTNNVTNTAFMFDNCRQLKRIIVNKWSNQNNTNSDGMFLQCSELVGGNGTKYDYNHIDATYARIDKVGSPGYFTDKSQASGLQIIKKDELKQNTIFTLSGQRLVNPCKGINIINGRPYIIK